MGFYKLNDYKLYSWVKEKFKYDVKEAEQMLRTLEQVNKHIRKKKRTK